MVLIRPFGPIRTIYLFDFQTGQCKTWHRNRLKQIIFSTPQKRGHVAWCLMMLPSICFLFHFFCFLPQPRFEGLLDVSVGATLHAHRDAASSVLRT